MVAYAWPLPAYSFAGQSLYQHLISKVIPEAPYRPITPQYLRGPIYSSRGAADYAPFCVPATTPRLVEGYLQAHDVQNGPSYGTNTDWCPQFLSQVESHCAKKNHPCASCRSQQAAWNPPRTAAEAFPHHPKSYALHEVRPFETSPAALTSQIFPCPMLRNMQVGRQQLPSSA